MTPVARHERRSRKRPPFACQETFQAPNQNGVDADNGDVSPRQGKFRLRRLAAAAACALSVFALIGPPAAADEWAGPTTQAMAYNAEWVPYLDPPAKPAAVCLV